MSTMAAAVGKRESQSLFLFSTENIKFTKMSGLGRVFQANRKHKLDGFMLMS